MWGLSVWFPLIPICLTVTDCKHLSLFILSESWGSCGGRGERWKRHCSRMNCAWSSRRHLWTGFDESDDPHEWIVMSDSYQQLLYLIGFVGFEMRFKREFTQINGTEWLRLKAIFQLWAGCPGGWICWDFKRKIRCTKGGRGVGGWVGAQYCLSKQSPGYIYTAASNAGFRFSFIFGEDQIQVASLRPCNHLQERTWHKWGACKADCDFLLFTFPWQVRRCEKLCLNLVWWLCCYNNAVCSWGENVQLISWF